MDPRSDENWIKWNIKLISVQAVNVKIYYPVDPQLSDDFNHSFLLGKDRISIFRSLLETLERLQQWNQICFG